MDGSLIRSKQWKPKADHREPFHGIYAMNRRWFRETAEGKQRSNSIEINEKRGAYRRKRRSLTSGNNKSTKHCVTCGMYLMTLKGIKYCVDCEPIPGG